MTDRKIEKEIVIDCDVESVWKALTEAEELKRWFGLDARVTPGRSGSIWVSWSGPEGGWESPIAGWDPPHHLRTLKSPGSKVAVDYSIESRGGKTVLRLVHSGFAADSWDDEFDTLDSGWAAFLENLRLYLERHRGEPRLVAHARHEPIALARSEAFVRTMHVLGFRAEQPLAVGCPYSVTTEAGDRLQGEVLVYRPPINFSATVENLGDAFLMVEIEPGRERIRPAIWLSLYGEARRDGAAIEQRLRSLMQQVFA